MITVIIPIVLLIAMIMLKKIPFVRGSVARSLIIAGLVALILGNVYNPINWVLSWTNGLDRLAWVMALSLVGSFYGETQRVIGALDVVVELFRALFGKSKRGLVIAVILAVAVGGEAFGDSIAAASVIGVMVIPALSGLGMSGEKIAATILYGSLLGSIMPPISQAVYLSCSILGIDTFEALRYTYITAGISILITLAFAAFTFVDKGAIPDELKPKEKAEVIIKKGYKSLLPLFIIVVLLIVNAALGINIGEVVLGSFYATLSTVPIIRGLSNSVVIILILASLITFLWKDVRAEGRDIFVNSFVNVWPSISIQACAAFFIGAIYAGGQIEVVTDFAKSLNPDAVRIGGGSALLTMAMITGSQTSGQNIIFSFFGPMLVEIGVDPSYAAITGSHIASAGQALPPSNTTAYVAASMVGSALSKTSSVVPNEQGDASSILESGPNVKVDPIKCMLYCIPVGLTLGILGFLFMYI